MIEIVELEEEEKNKASLTWKYLQMQFYDKTGAMIVEVNGGQE